MAKPTRLEDMQTHFDADDPIFDPMQQALLERIARHREIAEIKIRYE